MIERFDIAGYCRISVDEELDRDNTSIENQKAIIEDFVRQKFPGSSLTFFEDRDRSGYTFEQREGYQAMRRELLGHRMDILVVKDFSRFSRRNSRGLVELEDLRDAGVRIISIGDGIDFPGGDDWLKIQFQFLINEMPVTDTSKKVRAVIRRRQADGKWICAAPYGYRITRSKEFEPIPEEAEVVKSIFNLYNQGWGYKRIANYLTDQHIPTPRMAERERMLAEGLECRIKAKPEWSIASVQGILDNDFYIGTLRQGKYTRRKINGEDIKREESEQIVFENHHEAIIPYRTFAATRMLRAKRTTAHYRGVRINDNAYSGFLFCGDCGSPMFSQSRSDLKAAYLCGNYHRRGRKGCTRHHIRVDTLDALLKEYVRCVKDNSAGMLERLNGELAKEQEDVRMTEQAAVHLDEVLRQLQEELKATKRQRVRDILKHPEQEAVLEETYDELESDLARRIEGVRSQIAAAGDRRNTILQVNRAAKTAMEVFDDILTKPSLSGSDLRLLLRKIDVFEDHLDIWLNPDIDALLREGRLAEAEEEWDGESVNFKPGIIASAPGRIVQRAKGQPDRSYDVNVINDGDPLEIYTDRDGEVIFRKYSLMGGLSDFAAQICDAVYKSTGRPALVTDRDTVLAVAGAPKREFGDKQVSDALESVMMGRGVYQHRTQDAPMPVISGNDALAVAVAAPILAQGDVLGCVVIARAPEESPSGETEHTLVQTIAGFLGRHMEN